MALLLTANVAGRTNGRNVARLLQNQFPAGPRAFRVPGVDSLNHARGQPVSWLVTRTASISGQELFNNYGLKPNSELILGYGFSLPHNPDDTIVLKVGGIEGRWEIGRDAQGADGLWKVILSKFVEASDATYEDILDASGMLQEMLESLIEKLPEEDIAGNIEVRADVVEMFHHYLEGMSNLVAEKPPEARSQVKMPFFALW
ncbi:unnamed protein product [Cyclocybe aegerita]|uniref:SET domain-containing protein n=1 Tax=Cyclocybe aegerita TaxID=1973307 RepID=A0A8S0VTE4_CYCAE|nr:unnamed protein product [Cyclocybe aegerita]